MKERRIMNRIHCNNCNVEVGHTIPFMVGDTTWFRLDVFGNEYDYCVKCKPIIENKLNKLLSEINIVLVEGEQSEV